MSLLLLTAVAVAGGVGAALRLVVDMLIRRRVGPDFPVSTLVINVTGSLLLGLLTGLSAGALLPVAAATVLGSGFLGGYTTFSTASYETVRLLEERHFVATAAYALGGLVLAVVAAGTGLLVGLSI
ncbi:MAG TPA: CrcB family protein [Propionibacteriaceae bacterium]|jgi:CrcB protein